MDAPNNSKIFFKRRPRAYIAFSLITVESYSNDDLSAAGPLHPPRCMYYQVVVAIIILNIADLKLISVGDFTLNYKGGGLYAIHSLEYLLAEINVYI
jgi:hypothetical protein